MREKKRQPVRSGPLTPEEIARLETRERLEDELRDRSVFKVICWFILALIAGLLIRAGLRL